ncbi:DUF3978 family protein [Bacillus thuringiensis]|uniref:DUF3978 family protein n=1 Tax=Bacillus thuringiensis TaxID=1428 RepID=UPI0022250EBF|nr:DUF3978 family protein [Bacillus thuringiensis]UYX52929.1 DUF3978 family protein [Bacillus thuringiensis]
METGFSFYKEYLERFLRETFDKLINGDKPYLKYSLINENNFLIHILKEKKMNTYNNQNIVLTNIESISDRTNFNLYLQESNDFDPNLIKCTMLEFIVTKENVKIYIKHTPNCDSENYMIKEYMIPSKVFQYVFPTIHESNEEISVQMQCFGINGELLIMERLFIHKNNHLNSKLRAFFEALNSNIHSALHTLKIN